MAYVNKKIFFEARNCLRKAWLMAHDCRDGRAAELNGHREFIIENGEKINELARKFFPGGILIADIDYDAAAARTRELMAEPSTAAIFGGVFMNGPLVARTDIIVRDIEGGGWKLIDVKSYPHYNFKKSSVKRPRYRSGRYFTTAGFNYMLMKECGVRVTGVSIMYISRFYRYGMSENSIFTEYECTLEADRLGRVFEMVRGSIASTAAGSKEPEAVMTTICKNCGYYEGCPVSIIKEPIFLFNSINQKKFAAMFDEGYRSIADIPDGYFKYPSDGMYYMMHKSVKTGMPFIGPDFKKALAAVRWPVYYLDFESLSSVLPVYKTSMPYEHLLVQYSLHVKESPDCAPENIRHFEYIAEPGRDCRYELFKNLIDCIGPEGSIIVYSDFERQCLYKAAERFPVFRERLSLLAGRLFDLCDFIRRHYYHPDFKGLYSIKKILPVLVPGMSYDSLPISNGGDAIVKHYELAAGNLKGAERARTVKELLDYCSQDTIAMVKLHEKLIEIGNINLKRF